MLGLGCVKTRPMEVLNLQKKAKILNCTLRFLGTLPSLVTCRVALNSILFIQSCWRYIIYVF